MSESPDRERLTLDEIERALSAEDPRLARLLARPGRWARWWWGAHHEWLVALIALAVTSAAALVLGLLFG
jgi:hypothetical protein